MADRAEWEVSQKRRRTENVQREARHLRQVAQAEAPMTVLTGVREWDLYLQVVQAMIVRTEASAKEAAARLEAPEVLDHDQMMVAKIELLKLRQAVVTMTELRDLPQMLIERGRAAKKLLKDHGIKT